MLVEWDGKVGKIGTWGVKFRLDSHDDKFFVIVCKVRVGGSSDYMSVMCMRVFYRHDEIILFRESFVLHLWDKLLDALELPLWQCELGAKYKLCRKYLLCIFKFFKDELGDCKEYPDTDPEWLRGWSAIARQLFPKSDPLAMLAFEEVSNVCSR